MKYLHFAQNFGYTYKYESELFSYFWAYNYAKACTCPFKIGYFIAFEGQSYAY